MTRRRLAAFVAASLLLGGCATDNGPAGNPDDKSIGFQAGDGSVVILPVAEREVAPELAGEGLDGGRISTADHRGKVVVLNVWGSWCAPCRAEAPALVEVARLRKEVQFIGLNTRDLDPAPARAFVRSFEVPYPNIYDPDGALLLGFGQLPPKAIPSTLVLDAEGRVAARILGETTAATLGGVIDDVLEGS